MSKYLDSRGVSYLWSKIKDYMADHRVTTLDWSNVQNKPDLALKSDLASVYRYKGSVENYASLPMEENTVGDVWNVEATDMNYGWTGSAWDPLGQVFQIDAITNAEIDAIVDA